MNKFTIDVMELQRSDNIKTVVRLSVGGSFGGKVSISWVYSEETAESVLCNKDYYQRQLIQQIADNGSWEDNQ